MQNQLRISFTYDEYDNKGVLLKGGFYNPRTKYQTSIEEIAKSVNTSKDYRNLEFSGTLEEAVAEAKKLGCVEPSCPIRSHTTRVTFSSPKRNGQTQYNIHFAGADEATMRKIAQLFNVVVG